MDDIIRSIIEIDRGAGKKLDEAEKEKLRIISAAKALEEQMINDAIENSRNELERLENEKIKSTNDKIAELENEKNVRIADMEKRFSEKSDMWCDEIFKAVISI